jgi:hypothetical protein
VAAPTAGLHFDDALFARLDAAGVRRAFLTLHVGAGTFQPVRTENLSEHKMHSEWYAISPELADAVRETRARRTRDRRRHHVAARWNRPPPKMARWRRAAAIPTSSSRPATPSASSTR